MIVRNPHLIRENVEFFGSSTLFIDPILLDCSLGFPINLNLSETKKAEEREKKEGGDDGSDLGIIIPPAIEFLCLYSLC